MHALLKSLALLLLSSFAAQAQTIRVNCGGPAYTDASGNVWAADTSFAGGTAYTQASSTVGPLFQSIRYAPQGGSFVYTFAAVPNSTIKVNLYFQELWSGHRSINVLINGVLALDHFDVFAKAGSAPDTESIAITVTTGSIAIELDSIGGNGYIDAIEILPATPPQPTTLPFNFSLPGAGGGLGFTVTVPGGAVLPECSLSDGNCSLTLQVLDCHGASITMIVPGCAATLSIQKTSSTSGNATTLLANVTSP